MFDAVYLRQRDQKTKIQLEKTNFFINTKIQKNGFQKKKAGTKEADRCTLILTEGDSAKALAVSGLSVVGRDYFGVFALRGKLVNVRDAKFQQIVKVK